MEKQREAALPESNSRLGAILVEKFAPVRVGLGETFEYEIRLTNYAEQTIQSVVLIESVLSVLTIEGSSPSSQLTEPHMGRWLLGPIRPRQSAKVRVSCTARKALRFRSHTSVSYSLED